MNRNLSILILAIFAMSCDRIETNKQKLVGEWLIDSIEAPAQLIHLLQVNSHLVFDAELRFGLFLPNTTDRDLLLTYSVNKDELTILTSDQSLRYEIEAITNKSLILREISGDPKERFKIFLRKTD